MVMYCFVVCSEVCGIMIEVIRCEVFIYTWSSLRFPAQIQPTANWFSSGLLRDPRLG